MRLRIPRNARAVFLCVVALGEGVRAEPEQWTDAAATAVVAGPDEPGDRLVVRGTVYAADGVTPAPRVELAVFQTDHTGRYTPEGTGAGNERDSRLKARLRTDARGRYELRTIVPGRYPGSGPPPHNHIHVIREGGRVQDATVSFRDRIVDWTSSPPRLGNSWNQPNSSVAIAGAGFRRSAISSWRATSPDISLPSACEMFGLARTPTPCSAAAPDRGA